MAPKEFATLQECSRYHDNTVRIVIAGAGIAGLALARALQLRGVRRIVVLERDGAFGERAQGYGLTLQQGGRALQELNLIQEVRAACSWSRSHCIFNSSGQMVLAWSAALSLPVGHSAREDTRWISNAHIPRQRLRQVLFDSLDPECVSVVWSAPNSRVEYERNVVTIHILDGSSKLQTGLLVGCDGIFSSVRQSIQPQLELKYLQTLVVLGIVEYPTDAYRQRVVQVSDGKTRVFAMPFDEDRCMWQLSFTATYEEASSVSRAGPQALKEAVLKRCTGWTRSVPLMLQSTDPSLITGYPVWDRTPVSQFEWPDKNIPVTIIGDAAHPMSPFKGQGANQALLDALQLAKLICDKLLETDQVHHNIAPTLREFEEAMLKRTHNKVLGSREGVAMLHCNEFLDTAYQLERRGYSKHQSELIQNTLLENSSTTLEDSVSELDALVSSIASL